MQNITQTVLLNRSERIYGEFRDSSGTLTDVDNPRVDIYNPSATIVVDSASPSNEDTGIYFYNLSLTTASASVEQGLYQVWWSGSLGGYSIYQDDPRYILVRQQPYQSGLGGELIDDVRRFIGDDDPTDYSISQVDMHYYVEDGVDRIQLDYPMGYIVAVTPTSLTFNKTLTALARELFKRGTSLVILEHLKHKGLWGAGSIDIGDMRVNLTNINRARTSAVKEIKEDLKRDISIIKRRYTGGVSIDTYASETSETVGSWLKGIRDG